MRRTAEEAPSAPMHQRARTRISPSGPSSSATTRPSGLAGRVGQVDEAMTPEDLAARFGERSREQLLVAALLEDLDAGKPGGALLHLVDPDAAAGGLTVPDLHANRTVGAGHHALGQPELVVDLHGPGLYRQSAATPGWGPLF